MLFLLSLLPFLSFLHAMLPQGHNPNGLPDGLGASGFIQNAFKLALLHNDQDSMRVLLGSSALDGMLANGQALKIALQTSSFDTIRFLLSDARVQGSTKEPSMKLELFRTAYEAGRAPSIISFIFDSCYEGVQSTSVDYSTDCIGRSLLLTVKLGLKDVAKALAGIWANPRDDQVVLLRPIPGGAEKLALSLQQEFIKAVKLQDLQSVEMFMGLDIPQSIIQESLLIAVQGRSQDIINLLVLLFDVNTIAGNFEALHLAVKSDCDPFTVLYLMSDQRVHTKLTINDGLLLCCSSGWIDVFAYLSVYYQPDIQAHQRLSRDNARAYPIIQMVNTVMAGDNPVDFLSILLNDDGPFLPTLESTSIKLRIFEFCLAAAHYRGNKYLRSILLRLALKAYGNAFESEGRDAQFPKLMIVLNGAMTINTLFMMGHYGIVPDVCRKMMEETYQLAFPIDENNVAIPSEDGQVAEIVPLPK